MLISFLITFGWFTIVCDAMPMSKNVSQGIIKVKAIQDKPLEFSGKTVRLDGVFKGWKGSCRSGPPKSRSDWMVEDGTGCIYVHGTLPNNLQPMAPKDEPIILEGVVRLTTDGIPYLETKSQK